MAKLCCAERLAVVLGWVMLIDGACGVGLALSGAFGRHWEQWGLSPAPRRLGLEPGYGKPVLVLMWSQHRGGGEERGGHSCRHRHCGSRLAAPWPPSSRCSEPHSPVGFGTADTGGGCEAASAPLCWSLAAVPPRGLFFPHTAFDLRSSPGAGMLQTCLSWRENGHRPVGAAITACIQAISIWNHGNRRVFLHQAVPIAAE